MVPASACAAAAMRMPPGDFLREMYGAMDDAEKSLLNDSVRKTGKYDSVLDLIAEIEIVARVAETGRLIARETHVLAELEEQFEDAYYARGSLRADSPKNAPTRSSPRLAERKKLR